MLTQAGRLLGIFKTCAPVPAGEPWAVASSLVFWAHPPGTRWGVQSWRLEEALPARPPSPELLTILELTPSLLWLGRPPQTGEISGLLQGRPEYVPQ